MVRAEMLYAGQVSGVVSRLLSEAQDFCSSVVSCCCEKLVTEAGGRSGTKRKWNVRCWKPVQSTGSEDVIVDASVRVTVTVQCSHVLYEKVPSSIQNLSIVTLNDVITGVRSDWIE
jgi:hypothetical protein